VTLTRSLYAPAYERLARRLPLALALLAVLGFAAGCGSAKKAGPTTIVELTLGSVPVSGSITVTTGVTTIPSVKTGIRVTCKGWKGPGVKVPPLGGSVGAGHAQVIPGKKSSGAQQMSVTHRMDGSATVSCKP
jgi:hypothetical protein